MLTLKTDFIRNHKLFIVGLLILLALFISLVFMNPQGTIQSSIGEPLATERLVQDDSPLEVADFVVGEGGSTVVPPIVGDRNPECDGDLSCGS